MTLVFNPIGSTTFAFSEDEYRLATAQIQLWSAGIDLLADAKIESDLSENDFTTYNIYSNCALGIELKLCVSRNEPGYIQIEFVVVNNSQKVIQLDRIEPTHRYARSCSISAYKQNLDDARRCCCLGTGFCV